MLVEIGDRPRLPEMFHAKRDGFVAGDGAEPGEGGGVAVDDGDDGAVAWKVGEELLHVAGGVPVAAAAVALGGGPAGVEAVGRGDGRGDGQYRRDIGCR